MTIRKIKHKLRLLLLPALCAWISPALQAQDFQKMLDEPSKYSFEEIKSAAKTYYDQNGTGKGSGYKQYMRWQWFMESRLDEQGRLHNPKIRNFEEAQKFREFEAISGKTASPNGNWISKGPSNYTTTIEGTGPGLGRLNTLAFDPVNSNTVYVGAPDGGLWKSTNNGSTWASISDGLANLGVSGVAIHPTDNQTIYSLTGDGPGVISTLWPSIHNVGVMKTTNGGTSWQSTNLPLTAPNASRGHRLLMDPVNPDYLLIATSTGIYYTDDGGANWDMRQSGEFRSMEYKPGNPTTVYASTPTAFYRSTNRGFTWSQVSSSVLPTNSRRSILAVSPDEPNWIYLAYARSSGDFNGLFRSTDGGNTWAQRGNTATDYFDLSVDGSGGTAVGQYALAMAVNPNNADLVDLAALSHWRSSNGGNSFSIVSYWDTDVASQNGLDYCHGDFHYLTYQSNGDLWACNDGGVWEYPPTSLIRWIDRSAGLRISQIYRLAERNSQTSPIYMGTQDNGLFKYTGSPTFTHALIGDIMDIVVDPSNTNNLLAERQSGQLYRSTDAGVTFQQTSETSPTGTWITPLEGDPNNGSVAYTINSSKRVRRTTNGGQLWTTVNSTARPTVDIEVAPSSSATIYSCSQTVVWKTINTGTSWTTVTGNLPVNVNNQLSDLEIDESNPNRVWATMQGYSAANKVFVTTNGGSTWTNLSAGLPNVPINAVVHEQGSDNGIYIGTDVGVWYRDDNTAGWVDYNTGLPSVVILDLEIFQPSQGASILRAGSYGRGYWESDLFTGSTCPASLSLTGTVSSSTTFEAENTIASSQTLSGSSTDVVYDAGESITLSTGFSTVAGLRSFETRLVGCSSNKAQPITGVYEGPMPGVSIPYELPSAGEANLGLRLAPNPGSDLVSYIFRLPQDARATLAIYTLTGEQVSVILEDREYSAGEYRIRHDVSELPNGIYFVKISDGNSQKTERLVILH